MASSRRKSVKRPRLSAVTCVLAFFAAGCSGRVIVVDPAGQPVSGAAVSPVSLSINGFAKLTNAMGEADVQYNVSIQETKWIQISKEGYVTQQVDRPEKWPLRVVLHPSDVVKGGEP